MPQCGDCLVDGAPVAGVPNRWQCPQCCKECLTIQVKDGLGVSDSYGVYGKSEQLCGGLPAREYSRHGTSSGAGSGTDVERYESGICNLTRFMQPAGPSPRDSMGSVNGRKSVQR